MRYRLMQIDGQLSLCIYPEPFSFDATPEDRKQYFTFEFSDTGYEEAIACLNEVFLSKDWNKEKIPFK